MTEIKMVPLRELEHDPAAIAGHEKRLEQLDDLLASLPVHGLNQSLRVRPWSTEPPKGKRKKAEAVPAYGVIAGNRRLATLRQLRDAGETILGQPVTDDWPVPVIIGDEDDESAYQITSAENVQRLALTPVEEFKAFAKMASTKTPAEVAAHFGVPEKRVKQRLRLAALHPDVLAALESGKIGIAAAEAFAIEPNADRQAAYLAEAKSPWALNPDAIKRGLSEQLTSADGRIAKLIGPLVYAAAGGEVFHDEFGGGDYWISADVVNALLAQHWAKRIEAWKAEGWSFVQSADEYNAAANDRWAAQYSSFTEEPADGDSFTDEQLGRLGVVYWTDDSRAPKIGVVAASDRDATGIRHVVAALTLEDPGYDTARWLSKSLDAAVGAAVTERPKLALAVLFAALHASYRLGAYRTPLAISADKNFETDDDNPPPPEAGESFPAALNWALRQIEEDQDYFLCRLADMIGAEVDLNDGGDEAALIAAAAPKFAEHFDAKTYFNQKLAPELLTTALNEMGVVPIPEGTKVDLAAQCCTVAAETGWLPPQLRYPGYTGPGEIPKRSEDDEGEEDEELVEDELAEAEAAE